jgi:KDO2-lipid IV(A) lauroyltransferase
MGRAYRLFFLTVQKASPYNFSIMSEQRLLHRLGFFYLQLIGFFGHILPRGLMFFLAFLIGNLYWAIMARDRRMVQKNLTQILGDPGRARRTARRTFIHYAKYLVDYTRMDLLHEENYSQIVHRFEGQRHIDQALAKGKGALILTGHLGNWEMGGVFLILRGYSLMVITAPDFEVRLHRYRVRLRQGHRIKVVTLNDTLASSLSILKALKDNELVALLGDRDLLGKGVPVDFFGKRVYFPMGPSLLASLSGAPLIPTFVIMDEKDQYVCLAEAPLELQKTEDREADLAVNTQRIAHLMEKHIRAHPEQWFTFYDFFERHRVRENP